MIGSLGKLIGTGNTQGLYYFDGNFLDSSGSGNHGTAFSVSSSDSGSFFGGYAHFFSDSYISVGGSSTFVYAGTTPHAIRVTKRHNPYEWGVIMSNHNHNVSSGWSVAVHSAPTNRYTFQRADAPYYYQSEKLVSDLNPNNIKRPFLHIFFRYDGSKHNVLINGEPGATVNSGSNNSTSNQTYIGIQKVSNVFSNGFSGDLDTVMSSGNNWSNKMIWRDYAQTLGVTAPRIMF